MSYETFKFPLGITSVEEWQRRYADSGGVARDEVMAIQRDAVMAARQEVAVKYCDCGGTYMHRIRRHDSAHLCSFCDCEVKGAA